MRQSREDSDSRSFWAGFFFGWMGVLWSGSRKGLSGADHALAGHVIQKLSGVIIMVVLFIVAMLALLLKL